MEQLTRIIETHFFHDNIVKVLFKLNIKNIYTSKIKCLQIMLSNIFLNETTKEEIMNTFYNIQRFIHAILLLKRIWKWKRATIYNTDDLYMNTIHAGQKNTLTLLQNNTKYIFQIRELIGTVNTALSNSCHFFLEPIICKNPYTNIPFDKSSLYNIYFAVRSSTFIMPPLLHKYFLSDFHLSEFSIMNQHTMNQEYLRTYVDNNCAKDVRDIVKDMFDDHRITMKINKSFPKDKLFTIMKPYLHLYFISNYSLNEYKKRLHYKQLHRKLHEFFTFNPNFGRKKVRFIEVRPFSKSKKIEHYFEDKHIDFNEPVDCRNSSKHFLNSHLCNSEFYNRNLFYAPSINNQIQRLTRRLTVAIENRADQEGDGEGEEEGEEGEGEGEGEGDQDQISSHDSDSDTDSEYELREEYNEYSSSDSDTVILEDSDVES